jgi:hypothetical protein
MTTAADDAIARAEVSDAARFGVVGRMALA